MYRKAKWINDVGPFKISDDVPFIWVHDSKGNQHAMFPHYTSTYCIDAILMGDSELHNDCRIHCKNCGMVCLCYICNHGEQI